MFSVRCERQFCDRLRPNLLLKCFPDLNVGDPAFDPSTSSKNKAPLLEHTVAGQFF